MEGPADLRACSSLREMVIPSVSPAGAGAADGTTIGEPVGGGIGGTAVRGTAVVVTAAEGAAAASGPHWGRPAMSVVEGVAAVRAGASGTGST